MRIKEYLKKYYLYGIAILGIIIIAFILLLRPKAEVQTANVKLEQLEVQPKEEVVNNVKIDIKGNIQNPGVYEMSEGSRVIDAINMAGGLLENSNTSLINLSQKLKDEMIIIIYTNDQIEQYKNDNKKIEYVYVEVEKCPDTINDACINKSEETQQQTDNTTNSLISINDASIEQLTTLPGIGKSKANDIIEYRNQNGKFQTIDDIKKVKGIGESVFEKIKDSITI